VRYLRMTIVILFTAAAITLPLTPHAAAANANFEAESMAVSPASAGRVIAAFGASGGYALELYQNSTASTNVSLPASISVVIRAKGEWCWGSPSMTVLIDGNAISTTTVSAASWTNYTTAATINAGEHTLSIAFTNARPGLLCSRALFLDNVAVVAGNPGGPGGNPYPNAGVWTTGGTITNTITAWSDIVGAELPSWHGPPLSNFTDLNGGSVLSMTTPYGGGWSFTVPATEATPWNNGIDKALFLQGTQQSGSPPDPDVEGTVAQWTTYINIPTQSFVNAFFSGWLCGFHTSGQQGHNLMIDVTNSPVHPTPAWRMQIPIDSGAINTQSWYGPAITFDVWHKIDVQIYWSNTSSGYERWYIDGVLLGSFSGATWFSNLGNPYLQFGFYAQRNAAGTASSTGGVTNYAQFGPWVRRQFAP
jgi:Ca-dependent carbohydrate-binding module xylan-binding